MARRPTSGKGAPSGPSNAPTGGGSARDRNRVGAAAGDSSKRAASVTGEATGDDKPQAAEGGTQTEDQPRTAKKEKSKPESFIVLTDRAVIDDGEGGDFKICKMHDEVKLTPERAKQFTDAGVSLITKDEHKQQQEAEKRA